MPCPELTDNIAKTGKFGVKSKAWVIEKSDKAAAKQPIQAFHDSLCQAHELGEIKFSAPLRMDRTTSASATCSRRRCDAGEVRKNQ